MDWTHCEQKRNDIVNISRVTFLAFEVIKISDRVQASFFLYSTYVIKDALN